MFKDKQFRYAFMFLLMTMIFGSSTVVFQSTALAQCARLGFKVSDGFLHATIGDSSTATGDFNSDGKIDVAITNSQNSTVTILFGDGLGKLGAPTWYIVGPAALLSIIVADMNNDTKLDLVIVGETAPFNTSVSVMFNNGTGGFGSAVTSSLGYLFNVQVADMNQDSKADLVTDTVNGVLQVRLGNGLGQFIPPTTTSIPGLDGFRVGDFNGDNKIDVAAHIIVPPSDHEIRQYLNNGVGGFAIGSPTNLGANRVGLAVATDLNADGKLDLAGSSGLADAVSVLLNNGSGGFTRTDYPSVDGRFILGDFNGDGMSDFLSFTLGSGTSPYVAFKSSVLMNDGSGLFSRADYKALPVFYGGIAADFNNDGKSDLLTPAYAPPLGQAVSQVWLNKCNYSLSTKRVDYDGDGITDFAVWRPSTGEWIIRQTDGNLLRTQQWGLGSLGDVPVPGDYDGDGISDLAVFREPSGDWWVFRSSDNTAMGIHWGASGDKPVPGDYDGDGKTDVAVFRASASGWFILRSSDSTMGVAFFGTIGDKPVQADYDNDDKTDVAVYRPSDGFWYIMKSSDGSFNYTHFGISTDKPVPGDYDGDGKADIAVFRAGEAWYFLVSSTNTFHAAVWHQDLPPAPGSYNSPGSIVNIGGWDPTSGTFHVYADSGYYSVGMSGDVTVTTPYVIE